MCEKIDKFKAGVVRDEPRGVGRAQGIKEGSHRKSVKQGRDKGRAQEEPRLRARYLSRRDTREGADVCALRSGWNNRTQQAQTLVASSKSLPS